MAPISWIAVALLARASWAGGALVLTATVALQLVKYAASAISPMAPTAWLRWIPKPPGTFGSIMRLYWREILQTLDPYVALLLLASTVFYRMEGRYLDAEALRILSLVVVLAMSTATQVLIGLDGGGVERYRQMPVKGWQILLAKDLAFLALLSLFVLPLDVLAGLTSGVAVLAIGHHRSVLQPRPQSKWRFTSGVLFPDGVIQIGVLFGVGNSVHARPLTSIALCCGGWLASLFLYGRQWDRRRVVR